MTIELLNALSIQAGGMALALASGIRQLRLLVPLGFIAGLCIHILIAALQSMVLLYTRPLMTIGLTAGLPLAWWLMRHQQSSDHKVPLLGVLVTLTMVGIAAVMLHAIDRINFHVDSHEYLAIGSMLVQDTFRDGVSMFQIEKRMLAVPLQHAAANAAGSLYFASVNPLLGVATVVLLASLCQAGLRRTVGDRRTALLIATSAGLLLVTVNRFVHNLFYINGHLLVAALMLLLAGVSWLIRSEGDDLGEVTFLPIQLLAIPVLVITRPEAAFLVAAVIAPTVLWRRHTLTHRMALVTVLGLSVVAWQLFLVAQVQERNGEVTLAMLGMLAFGALMLAASPLLQWRALEARPLLVLSGVEALLWMALLIAAIRDPEPLTNAVRATLRNTLEGIGGWGYSLVFLGVVTLLALIATRASERIALRYPLTTFLPLAFLLVYLRDGAYRVGAADSLNRMLIHIVPLTILFLASHAAAKPISLSSTVNRSQPAATSDSD